MHGEPVLRDSILTVLRTNVGTIRKNLFFDSYTCLSAFLADLGKLLSLSECVVLVHEFDDDRGIEVELGWARATDTFKPIESQLVEGIRSFLSCEGMQNRSCVHPRIRIDDVDHLVVLCRTWPSDAYRNGAECASYIGLYDPKFLSPLVDHGSGPYIFEVANLAGAWYRWEREKRDRRSALVAGRMPKKSEVIDSELDQTCVRPIPLHEFLDIVRGGIAMTSAAGFAERVKRVEKTYEKWNPKAACRCKGGTGGVCLASAGDGGELDTLRGLLYWETRFYEVPAGQRGEDWDAWLKTALGGLTAARDLLRKRIAFGKACDRTFLKYFVAKAVEDLWDKCCKRLNRNERPAQFAVAAHLANLGVMLVSDGAWTVETIESLIQVLNAYATRHLGVAPRLDIVSHLRQALRGEPALHTLKPFYRDHFLHAVEVCLMGDMLLDSHYEQDRPLIAHIVERCDGPHGTTSKEAFRRQWWVAALFHDVGYAVEILKRSLDLMSFFDAHPQLQAFRSEVRGKIAALREPLKTVAKELEHDADLGSDHGVIAAANLEQILKRAGEVLSKEYAGAVRAIAFHNSRTPAIKFSDDPLAALLVLCDSLQEWRRARLGFGEAPATLLTRMVEQAKKPGAGRFGSVDDIKFNIPPPAGLGREDPYYWETARKLTVTLRYDESVNRNSAVFFLWMDATYNLQRVDFSALEPDIHIVYATPRPDGAETQFERLEDCVREVGMPFVEPWIDKARSDTAAVRHEAKDRWEYLTIDIKALGNSSKRQQLLGGTIGDFYDRLRLWSRYNEDRDFSEDTRIRRPV